MIQIRRTHPIVKFAYMFNGFAPPDYGPEWTPYRTSLCPMFWRCVMNLIACLAAAALVLAFIYLGARGLIHHWRTVLLALGFGVAVAAVAGAIAFVMDKNGLGVGPKVGTAVTRGFDATTDAIGNSLAWKMVKAIKSKMCPLVTFTETE